VATRANSAFNYTAAVSATVKNSYWTTADTISKIGAASAYAYNQATAYTNNNYVKTTAYTEYTGTVANTLSKLQGGIGFVSGATSGLSANVVTYIDNKLSTVYVYKGTVNNYSDLPATGHVTGYVYNVVNANGNIPAGTNYAWNGTAWDALGGSVDLSNYATNDTVSQVSNLANSLKTGLSAWTYTNAATHTEVANASSHTLTSAATSATSIATEKANAAAQSALTRANAYTDEKTEALDGIQSTVNSLKTGLSAWTHNNAATHTEVANASSHTLTSAATSATSIATEKANAAAQSALTRANAYTDTKTQPIAGLQSDVSNLKTGLSAWTHNNAATHTEVGNASSHTLTSAATSAASIATAKANDAAQSALTRANKYTDDKTAGLSQMASDISTALNKANSAFNYTAAVSATVNSNYWTTGTTLSRIGSASGYAYNQATAYTSNNYVKNSTYNTFTGDTNSALSNLRQGVNFLSGATSGLSANVVTYIDNKLSTVYVYKGSVANYASLPNSGKVTGYVYNVVAANGNIPAGTNYAWNGSAWDALGGTVDLSNYATTGTVNDISSTVNSLKTGLSAWTHTNAATHAEVGNASSHTLTSAVTSANSIAIAKANDAAQSALTRANAYTDAKTAPISEIQNSITNINNRLANVALSARVDTLISNLNTVIEDNEVVMAAALTDLDSRIKNFSGSFLTVQSANTVITSLNNQVSTLNGTVSTHTNQIAKLNANSGSLQNQVTQLANNSGTMNTTLTNHTTSISTHTNQIAQLIANSGTMASEISKKIDATAATSSFVNVTGDTMSGHLNFGTASTAYGSTGLRWGTNKSGIGTDSAGGLGLYANDKIYIRPNVTLGTSSTNGLVVGNTAFTYNTYDVYHKGNLNIADYATTATVSSIASDVTTLKQSAATLNNKFSQYATKTEASDYAAAALGNSMAYTDSKIGDANMTLGDLSNKVAKLTSNSGEMQSTLTVLNNKVTQLNTNSGAMASQISRLTTNSGSLQNQISQLNTNSGSLQNQITQLRTNSGSLQNQISQLSSNSASMASDITKLKQDVGYASSATKTLSGDVVSFVNTKISSVYKYMGTVTAAANLPTTGQVQGYVYNVTNASGTPGSATYIPAGTNYAWDGSKWDPLGGTVDLSNYATTGSVNTLSNTVSTHTNQIAKLNANSGAMASQISQLTTNSGSLQNQITKLNANSGAMASQISRLTTNSGSLQNQITQLNTNSGAMASDITTLKASAVTLNDKFNYYATDAEASSYAAAALSNAMDYTDSKIGGANVNITDLTNKVAKLTSNSGDMQSTITTLNNKVAQLNANSGAMASQISQLTTNSGSLQNQISKLNANSGAMASQISRLITNSGSLQNQISQLASNSASMASTLSQKANSSDVVTALGTNGNNVTWTKNGTTNNLTVPYASTVARATFGDSGNAEHNANNIKSNGLWYYTANGPTTTLGATTADGALYSQAYSTSWVGQIAQDYRNGRLFVRGLNNGTWSTWLKVWDTGNFNPSDYATTGTVNGIASDVTTLKSSAATLNAKFDLYATETEASEYAAAALGNSMAYTDSKIGTANTNITDLTNKVAKLTSNSGDMQSAISTIQGNYVTTNTNQTISGTKTFSSTPVMSNGVQLKTDASFTNSDRSIPFGTNGAPLNIQWVNTAATTGFFYNPNTGKVKVGTSGGYVINGKAGTDLLNATGGTTAAGGFATTGALSTLSSTVSNKMDTSTANSTFVHKTGDTMTGVLTMKSNMYEDSYTGALNMANSNIYGLNAIYMADAAENAAEGINFYRDTTHVDTLWMASGKLNFTPNRQLGTNGTTYEVYHTGNLTISNYATYSALNSASGALNTRIATLESHDAMVKQENVTSDNYRPLLFSTNYNAAQASIPTTTVTGQTYFNKEIYAQPSTGELGATQMKVGGHVTLKYNTSTQALDFIFS
jgi:chromosome segregation ATPase